MPYIPNTPESSPGVQRTDSRDQNTTCKGLTCSGKRCKRSLPRASHSSEANTSAPAGEKGQIDKVGDFCWQHKDQAGRLESLRKTASYDTLIERLCNFSIHQPRHQAGLVLSEKNQDSFKQSRHRKIGPSQVRAKGGVFSWLCCSGQADQEITHEPKFVHQIKTGKNDRQSVATSGSNRRAPLHSAHSKRYTSSPATLLIPQDLDPQIQFRLRAELAKPISKTDGDGYIYMYRKVGDTFPKSKANPTELDSKILVKIGCTKNVQSRLSTWSGRCGTKVELLRYYPHISIRSMANIPRKTPCCHRVERLIHIELSGSRVKQKCICGSTHREWFEVGANVEAVKAVDAIIRKWVSWAGQQAQPL